MTENEIGLGKVFINSFSEFKFSDSLLSLSLCKPLFLWRPVP